jgi:hypothetical protein
VTLVDSRLTTHRLANFAIQAFRVASSLDVEDILSQILTSLAGVLLAWPHDQPARMLDVVKMMLECAPKPNVRLGPGSVSIAEGKVFIANIDADTAGRCELEDRFEIDHRWSMQSAAHTKSSTLTRACPMCRGHSQPG